MKTTRSKQMFEEARKVIPGGVNSPVRACRSVGCDPLFIERAQGSSVFDVDGNEYTDFVCSWGPMIMGHSHPDIVAAVQKSAKGGTSFGAPTPAEIELARLDHEAVRRDVDTSNSIGFAHVELDFFVDHQLVVKRQVVAVWIQLSFVERVDLDIRAELSPNFFAGEDHGVSVG